MMSVKSEIIVQSSFHKLLMDARFFSLQGKKSCCWCGTNDRHAWIGILMGGLTFKNGIIAFVYIWIYVSFINKCLNNIKILVASVQHIVGCTKSNILFCIDFAQSSSIMLSSQSLTTSEQGGLGVGDDEGLAKAMMVTGNLMGINTKKNVMKVFV